MSKIKIKSIEELNELYLKNDYTSCIQECEIYFNEYGKRNDNSFNDDSLLAFFDIWINSLIQAQEFERYKKTALMQYDLLFDTLDINEKYKVVYTLVDATSRLSNVNETIKYAEITYKLAAELNSADKQIEILIVLAYNINQTGNYEQALEKLKKAFQLVNDTVEKKNIYSLYSAFGQVYTKQANYDKAKEYYLMALNMAETMNNKLTLADAYDSYLSTQIRVGNYNEANQLADKAIAIAEEMESYLWLSVFMLSKAKILKGVGNYDDAVCILEKSYNLIIDEGYNPDDLGQSDQLAKTYRDMGFYSRAIEIYSKLLNEAIEKKLQSDISLFSYHLAYCYYLTQDYEKGLELFKTCERIDAELNDKLNMAFTARLLGLSYQQLNQPEKAEQQLLKALKIDEENKDEIKVIDDYFCLGSYYAQLNKHKEAFSYFLKMTSYLGSSADLLQVAIYATTIGNYCNQQNQEYDAYNYYRLARTYFKKLNIGAAAFFIDFQLACMEIKSDCEEDASAILHHKMLLNMEQLTSFFKYRKQWYAAGTSFKYLTECVNVVIAFTKGRKFADYIHERFLLIGYSISLAFCEYEQAWKYVNAHIKTQCIPDETSAALEWILKAEDEISQHVCDETLSEIKKVKLKVEELFRLDYGYSKNQDYTSMHIVYYWARAEKLYNEVNIKVESQMLLESVIEKAEQINFMNLPKMYAFWGRLKSDHHNYLEALDLYKKAAGLFVEQNRMPEANEQWQAIVKLAGEKKYYDIQTDAINMLYAEAEKSNKPNDQIEWLCKMADTYAWQKGYTQAVNYYLMALKIAEDTADKVKQISINHDLALMSNGSDIDKKEQYYHKAISLAVEEEDIAMSGIVQEDMAEFYEIAGLDDKSTNGKLKAVEYYIQSIKSKKLHPDDVVYIAEKAVCLVNAKQNPADYEYLLSSLTWACIENKEYTRGIQLAYDFEDWAKETKNDKLLAQAYRYQAEALYWQNNLDGAALLYENALKQSQLANDFINAAWDSFKTAEVYFKLENTEKAFVFLEKSLEWIELINQPEHFIYLLNKAFRFYKPQDIPDLIEDQLLKALNKLPSNKKYSERIAVYYALAGISNSKGEFIKEQECINKILNESENQNLEDFINANYAMADFTYRSGDYKMAISLYEKTIELAKGNIDGKTVVDYVVNLASCYYKNNELEKAIEVLVGAYKLDKSSHEVENYIHNNLAYYYAKAGNTNEAVKKYTHFIFDNVKTLDEPDLVRTHLKIASIYEDATDYKKAYEHNYSALKWAFRKNDAQLIMEARQQLGLLYIGMDKLDLAENNFKENLKEAEKEKDNFMIVSSNYDLSRVYLLTDEHIKAREVLLKAKKLAKQHGFDKAIESIDMVLDKIDDFLNNTKQNNKQAKQFADAGEAATQKQIDNCINELFDAFSCVPPNDYFEFLAKYNGWIFNGYQLSGTNDIPYVPSLLSFNEQHSNLSWLKDQILIGKGDEDRILYNVGSKKYEIVDRIDGLVFESFNNFDELWDYLASVCRF